MSKEFVFEGRGKSERTGNEKIAMKNIASAIEWIVGGYYNCLQDGYDEDLPKSFGYLADEVYNSAITNLYRTGYEGINRAPREMRFAGEKFCRAYVEFELANDEDTEEIADAAGWTDFPNS